MVVASTQTGAQVSHVRPKEERPIALSKKSPVGTSGAGGTCCMIKALVTGITNGSQCYLLFFRLPTALVHGLKCQPTNPSAFVDPPPVISLTSSTEFVSGEPLSGLRHDLTFLYLHKQPIEFQWPLFPYISGRKRGFNPCARRFDPTAVMTWGVMSVLAAADTRSFLSGGC